MTDDLADLWKEFFAVILAQVEAVELAVGAVVHGQPNEEILREGVISAHKLAGSVGSFGLIEASRAASELERALRAPEQIDSARARQLALLIAGLRRDVESA